MIPIIPRVVKPEDDRPIAYRIDYKDKDKKILLSLDEFDEEEVKHIQEEELDIVKGETYQSGLIFDKESLVEMYEDLSKKGFQSIRIMQGRLNENSFQVERPINIYSLKI